LQAGQAVVIQGLAQWERGHLNGQTGVLARRELSGRWRVQLDTPLYDESPRGTQVRREPGTGRLLVESAMDDGLKYSEPKWTVTVSPTALSAIGPAPESEEHSFQPQRPSSSPKSPWRPPKSLRHRPATERPRMTSEAHVYVRRELRGLSGAGTMQLAKIRHAGRKLGPPTRTGKMAMAEVSPLSPITSAHLLQRIVEMQQMWTDRAESASTAQERCIPRHVFGSATQAVNGLCAHLQYEGDRIFRPSFPSDVLTRAPPCDLQEVVSNAFLQCIAAEQHDPFENDLRHCSADNTFLLATGDEKDGMM